MAGATITHDEILARLALPWIDLVPSRRTMARRALPAHAHEPSPNVIVAALPADRTSLDVCSLFRRQHWKPGFNGAHVPTDFAWQVVEPGGARLLIFTWVNWLRNSRSLFEAFCRETNREVGTLTPDGVSAMESRRIPFRDCRLIHEDQLRERAPVSVKPQPAKAILAKAEELLRGRKSRFAEIDLRELDNNGQAHDDDLQEQLNSSFLVNFAAYEQVLCNNFGPPTETGRYEHPAIPINGLLRYAIWAVRSRRLYLAVSHEDRELPWVICLGVLV